MSWVFSIKLNTTDYIEIFTFSTSCCPKSSTQNSRRSCCWALNWCASSPRVKLLWLSYSIIWSFNSHNNSQIPCLTDGDGGKKAQTFFGRPHPCRCVRKLCWLLFQLWRIVNLPFTHRERLHSADDRWWFQFQCFMDCNENFMLLGNCTHQRKKVSSVHSAHQIIISLARLLIEIGSEFLLFKTSFCFFLCTFVRRKQSVVLGRRDGLWQISPKNPKEA